MISDLMAEYKWRLGLATLLSALSSGVSLMLIAMINGALATSGPAEIRSLVPEFLLAILALFAIGFSSQWLLAKLGTSLVYRIRSLLMTRVLGLSYEKLESIGGHRVHATVTTDVSSIAEALAIIPVFTVNLATVALCFGYLAYLSPPMFAVLVLTLGLGAALTILIMRRGTQRFEQLREREDDMFNLFKSMVDGSKELSLNHNRRRFFFNSLAKPGLDRVRKVELQAQSYWILSQSWSSTILFLCLGILVFCAVVVFQIDSKLLTSFVLFTTYIVGPISFVMRSFQSVFKGRVAYEKIKSLQLAEDQPVDAAVETVIGGSWPSLKAEGLVYSYRGESDSGFTIGPIDFEVRRGEILFIRGGNGSGKSTFAKVLVGLYPHHQGRLLLGETHISAENVHWFRSHFSTIFSDFYLFEHILDSKGALVGKQDVWPHVEKLGMADKVDIVDGKLSTTELSQGQRKRLAMLLSYAEDAPIYLFDEWAADQDPLFRHYFYKELLPELKRKGKTVIVISHDDKYFGVADRMYRFDLGKAYREDPKGRREELIA